MSVSELTEQLVLAQCDAAHAHALLSHTNFQLATAMEQIWYVRTLFLRSYHSIARPNDLSYYKSLVDGAAPDRASQEQAWMANIDRAHQVLDRRILALLTRSPQGLTAVRGAQSAARR